MAFDIESLGGGAGAGLIGTILGILGMNRENKRRITNLERNKQDKELCSAFHKGIEDKFGSIVEVQKDIQTELRSLNNHLMNRNKGYD